MIRRKHYDDDDNPERWLISYADFITLLFAFFVVMYSVSSVNQSKYKELSSSMNSAFSKDKKNGEEESATGNRTEVVQKLEEKPSEQEVLASSKFQAQQEEREAMQELGVNLANNLAGLIGEDKLSITQNNRGLRIDINDSVLFASGSAELADIAKEVLLKIATVLLINDHAIQVEGHTDNTPIHNNKFFSNWELSALRATSVVRMMADMGIAEKRLSALGFGSTQPVAENSTADGRAKNRHVSMIILYDSLSENNDLGEKIVPSLTLSKQVN